MKAKYRLKEWTKEEIRDFWGAPEEEDEEEKNEDRKNYDGINHGRNMRLNVRGTGRGKRRG